MGRRSTKTTKTGKFMNPTDQWRKEQRRKELKKNRKQRTAVREAVLRMKDPIVILQEIEEIEKAEEEMMSSGNEPVLPSEKGLLEKKRKLHSNLDRIVKYWQKEDPKKAHDVKQLILDSEKKRREKTKLYDSYREARSQCEVSDIPLPDTSDGAYIMPSDIPMPDELAPSVSSRSVPPAPPGPPAGAPPTDLRHYNIVEASTSSQSKRSVRFSAETTQEDEDNEREVGTEDKNDGDSVDEDEDRDKDDEKSESESDGEEFDPDALPESLNTKSTTSQLPHVPPPPPSGPPPLFTPRFPPPPVVGLPPGPPPGLPSGLRPPIPRGGGGMSFPHHPPPHIPAMPPPPSHQPHIQSQAVLSSHQPSSSSSRFSSNVSSVELKTSSNTKESSGGTTKGKKSGQRAVISAQPQLRNIQAEVTKFMPTSLLVRREVPKPTAGKIKTMKPLQSVTSGAGSRGLINRGRESGRGGGVQGDAYDAFMREMEGIL